MGCHPINEIASHFYWMRDSSLRDEFLISLHFARPSDRFAHVGVPSLRFVSFPFSCTKRTSDDLSKRTFSALACGVSHRPGIQSAGRRACTRFGSPDGKWLGATIDGYAMFWRTDGDSSTESTTWPTIDISTKRWLAAKSMADKLRGTSAGLDLQDDKARNNDRSTRSLRRSGNPTNQGYPCIWR